MGILQPKDQSQLIRVEEAVVQAQPEVNYADYVFDSDADAEGDDTDASPERLAEEGTRFRRGCQSRQQQQQKSAGRCLRRLEAISEVRGGPRLHKNMGARKRQRIENVRLLVSQADEADVCHDCSDILGETISAFSRLLRDEQSMKVWNHLMDSNDAEQERLIEKLERAARQAAPPKHAATAVAAPSSSERLHSAESCFERMDKTFKRFLLKRRNSIPYDFVDACEEQLRQFFATTPNAVYVEALASKYKRFHLHALAQYLALKSSSLPGAADDAGTIVQITNECAAFAPPDGHLVPLLLRKRRRPGAKAHVALGDDDEDGEL